MNDRIERHVWVVSLVVVLGSTMSILDTTIVNVALATLGADLHSTVSQIQWVVTGYTLALASVLPLTGWAAGRFGPRRMFVLSLVVFTIGSVLCGLSTTLTELVIFRVLQGLGGGMIMPLAMMMIAAAAGPSRMGRVMSVTTLPMLLAPILGPTIGGLIIDNASWRWIFYVNVPVGIVAVIAALRVLPRDKAGSPRPLDYRGLLYMALGLPLLTFGLAEVGSTGSFTSLDVVLPFFTGLALIAAFALHALKVRNPLLNLHLYRRRIFAAASVALFFLAAALFGAMILLPLYWQHVRDQSVLDAGLLMAPQGIGMALAMPVTGRVADRFGGGLLTLVGAIVTTIATVPFCLIGARTSIAWLSFALLVRGVGMGLGFVPAMTVALASLQRPELPDGTPQLNVVQRVGASLGTAVLAVVLQRALTGTHTAAGAASGYATAFWGAAGLSALAILPCIALLRAEHAARAARGAAAETLDAVADTPAAAVVEPAPV